MRPERGFGILILLLLVLLGLVVLAAAEAQADSLYTGAWSTHLSSGEYNEQHDLIAYERDRYILGYFKNSYNDDTIFIAKHWYKDLHDLRVGVYGGVMYGYRDCLRGGADRGKRVCPMIAPAISLRTTQPSPTLFLLGTAVAISVRWDF